MRSQIEGLIASSNMGHGQTTRPELIHEVVEAYAKDAAQPAAAATRATPRQNIWQPSSAPASRPPGRRCPSLPASGRSKDTPASDWILDCLGRNDPRPLWVAVWGGTADLAQALWRLRNSFSPPEAAARIAKLRVHSIGDQDSTGAWIKAEFPELFYITRTSGYRGMYRGGDPALSSAAWVEQHVKGHGALGDLFPLYDGGDIWSHTLGKVSGIKEGDTPSYLGMIPNGLNPRLEPVLGRLGRALYAARDPLIVGEMPPDRYPGDEHDPAPAMSTVYRWRPDFQADFQARMDECLPPGRLPANRPPLVRLQGGLTRSARAGETVRLDASASSDPQGRPLSFAWSFYHRSLQHRLPWSGPANRPGPV